MKQNPDHISVLIPDGETTLLYSVVYSLSSLKHVKLYVISSHKQKAFRYSLNNDCLKNSRYIEKFIYYPETNVDEWINHIDNCVERYSIDLIMPIFDDGTERIIKNRHKLKSEDKLCVLPSLSNFKTARHKDLLYIHAKSNNLPCPQSVIVNSKSKTEHIDLDLPLIAKPVVGFEGGRGVKLLRTQNDLMGYLESFTEDCNILVQKFIDGYDMSCNVLCHDGKILAYTMQKASSNQEGKVTPQLEFKFVHEESVLITLQKLMKSLKWSGIANIDFRYDTVEGDFKIIEINTKFWLNTEASALAGVNFPYMYCQVSLNKNIVFSRAKEITFLHLNAVIKRIKRNPFFIFKTKYISECTPLLFAIRDPLVTICKFFWRTNNIISSKFLNSKV